MEYEDMLDRGLAETPEIGDKSARFEIPDPEVRQEGNTTVLENFRSITEALGRSPDRVRKALQSELGTNGHIDERGRARLTGSFDATAIEAALDAFADEFVRCPECGLPDTTLERERGVRLVVCEACGARSPTGG